VGEFGGGEEGEVEAEVKFKIDLKGEILILLVILLRLILRRRWNNLNRLRVWRSHYWILRFHCS
jgi:hypothetical protein